MRTNNQAADTGGSISTDTWHHVVGGYNGTDLFIYVDGVLRDTTTANYNDNPTADVSIGEAGSSQWYEGSIDEVMVFNRVLSETEIKKLYNLIKNIGLWRENSGNAILPSGHVGIGGFVPNSRLSIQGSESGEHSNNAGIAMQNTAPGGDTWYLRTGANGTSTPPGGFSIADTTAYRLVIDETGNVGVGTTTPYQQLHVLASGSSSYSSSNERGILITDSLGPRLVFEDTGEGADDKVMSIKYENENLVFGSLNDVGSSWNVENILAINRDGFVGIGTIAPGLPLEVRSADDNQGFFFDSRAQAQGVGGGIAFGGKYNDAGGEAMAGRIGTKKTNGISGDVGFDMVFETQDWEGSITERMILTSDGKVGLGDIAPTKALDVNGDTRIRGELETDNGIIISGDIQAQSNILVDIINEYTGSAGVTIEGVRFENSDIFVDQADSISFGDNASISSETIGHIDLNADLVIDMNAPEIRVHGEFSFGSSELTIAGGSITVMDSYHRVDTQNDDATDNLDTINGGVIGQILILRTENNARDVTIRDEQDNIKLVGGVDFTLDTMYDKITLIYDVHGGGYWVEISRSNID